jgi:hypothetical protein
VTWGVVALLTIGASSALASPPDFGRCVKVATGTGTFATGNCTTEGGEKKFDWLPGPGPKPGFSLVLKPETGWYMEGAISKGKITCAGVTGTGTVTGPTTVGLSLTMTACETSGGKCRTAGFKEGEFSLPGMTGELGVTKAGETHLKDQIGLNLAGEWGFECGGGVVKAKITGSAIGVITGHNMTTLRKWTFKVVGTKTRQVPERFEGGLPQQFEANINGTEEKIGFSLALTLTSEEKIEINTVV